MGEALQPHGLCKGLYAVRKHDADRHELGEDPEQLGVGQHAVLQAVIQEAGVVAENIVDVGGRFQVVLHDVPGRLDHLKHHVVLNVLHKVEHPLAQGKRSSKPFGRGQTVQLEVFVADPDIAQQPLHVFAVKHVSEKHLVPRQCFPREREGILERFCTQSKQMSGFKEINKYLIVFDHNNPHFRQWNQMSLMSISFRKKS